LHYGCRKERKELDKERKARRNKNFGLIEEAKGLWEELRRHDLSADKRAKLVTAILAKCQGRLAELAGSHSASRIIQSCAKYGTAAERAAILKELQPKLLELAKSPYGHFVVSKLVALAPKEQLPGAQQPPALPCTTEPPSFLRRPPPSPLWTSGRALGCMRTRSPASMAPTRHVVVSFLPPRAHAGLLKAFRGHLGELLRHPAGCQVVDDLYAGEALCGARMMLRDCPRCGFVNPPRTLLPSSCFTWTAASVGPVSQGFQTTINRISHLARDAPHALDTLPSHKPALPVVLSPPSPLRHGRSRRRQAAQPDGGRVLRQGVCAV
jgi:hypothetical protein